MDVFVFGGCLASLDDYLGQVALQSRQIFFHIADLGIVLCTLPCRPRTRSPPLYSLTFEGMLPANRYYQGLLRRQINSAYYTNRCYSISLH